MNAHTIGAAVPAPRPGQLRDPLLKALAKATSNTANVFIQHTEILDATIREAGFDPDNLPAGWDRKCRSNGGGGAGLDRNISLAFRYAYRDKKPPLTIKGDKPGLWGLTDAGVSFASTLQPVPKPRPLPRPKMFYEPLLRVLGKLSDHRPEVSFSHDDVIDLVMRDIGVDPNNLPHGWDERGSNRQIKALDRVRWAVKSMKGAKDPLIGQPNRGQWCLTPAGVEAARALNGVTKDAEGCGQGSSGGGSDEPVEGPEESFKSGGANETAGWLGQHASANGDLYKMARAALARRLPVSASSQMLDDHIQNWMMRAIERNALAKLIAAEKVPYSKVVAYIVNSGRTDARDMGTDALCREMFGARTEKERKEVRERRDEGRDVQFEDCAVSRGQDTDGNIIGPEGSTSLDDEALDFDLVWRQIETVVQDRKPQAWQRYANILSMKAQEYSTREIAKAEGVSRNRAASMLAEARRCVRESYEDGDLRGFLF